MRIERTDALHNRIHASAAGQRGDCALLLRRCKCDNGARLACACGATCAVEIVLRVAWCINVNDQRDAVNVNASSSNIGGD